MIGLFILSYNDPTEKLSQIFIIVIKKEPIHEINICKTQSSHRLKD